MLDTNILTHKIDQHHYQEFIDSAINPRIIDLNFFSIHDARELDKILNRNSRKRWKHSEELVPAWYARGIDPLTDEPTLQGVQVKPDSPPVVDGKIQKYLGAKEFETSPVFLDTGISGYWKQIVEDRNKPIVITEGVKKAASILSIDITSISIPGVSTCRKKGRLHEKLELFAKLGRTFYLCFDNDILYKKPVQNALLGLSRELAACGSKVMIVRLPEGSAKGADDFIAANGKDAFLELLKSASTFEEWKEEIDQQADEEEEPQSKSRLAKNYKIIKTRWGNYLRYNTLKKQVELHGTELKADEVRLISALEFDIDITTTDAHSIVKKLAMDDAYSPVVDYLDEVESKHSDIDPSFLDGLAKQYFGTDDPTHSTYFKKFLVSAVARARKPGSKVDTVFMLVSPQQGKYKSTFFRVLFGDEYFSDQLGSDVSDKDEKIKMNRFWCLEWAEFEAVYKKKDIASLKNFITSVEDVFRAPYDRDVTTYLRPCVFVGTSNLKEILHDPTGDRRFWIVPVTVPKIPIFQVLKDRDRIWAAANKLYKSGFEWKLTDEEELQREELNKEFHSCDYWEEVVEELLSQNFGNNWLSTETIIKSLGFESPRQLDAGSQARLSKVMTKLGFERKSQRVNGKMKRGWEKIKTQNESFDQNPVSGVTGVTPLINQGFEGVTSQDTLGVTGVTVSNDSPKSLDVTGGVSPSTSYPEQDTETSKSHNIRGVTGGVTGGVSPQDAYQESDSLGINISVTPETGFDQNIEKKNDFEYGDKVRLLTKCVKYSVGEEMIIYEVGNTWLKLHPVGSPPKDRLDNDVLAVRKREQVERVTPPAAAHTFKAEICPATNSLMPAGFEKQVGDKLVTFTPARFKRGKKSLVWNFKIGTLNVEHSIQWPLQKDMMISELMKLATGFVNQYCNQPWQPQINHKAKYGDETVLIVGYNPAKREYQVESTTGVFHYVKASKLSEPDQQG